MFDTLAIVKALADENRLRMLLALRGKELCVCTLTELLDIAPSTASKHLSILKQARLIESVKDGKFVYYRLVREDAESFRLAGPALEWLDTALRNSGQVQADAAKLQQIIDQSGHDCTDKHAAMEPHQLYRHVPGIHAIGDFGESGGK